MSDFVSKDDLKESIKLLLDSLTSKFSQEMAKDREARDRQYTLDREARDRQYSLDREAQTMNFLKALEPLIRDNERFNRIKENILKDLKDIG